MPSFESGKGRTSKAKLKAPKSTAARKGKGGAARRSRGSNRNGGDDQSAAKRLYRILASLGMDGQEEILGAIKAMAKGATAQTEKGKHARDLGYCVDVYHKRGTIPPKKVDEFLALVLELIAERKADLSATHAAEAARGKAGAKGKSRQQRKATLPAKRAAPKGPRVEYERDDADRDDYAQSIAAAPSRVTPGMAMLASVGERKAAEASAEHESHFAKSRREKAQRKQQLVVSLGFTARSYTERLVAQQAQRAAEEAKRVRAELEEERARAAVRAAAGFAHMQDRHDEELVSVLQRSVLEQAAERERFRGYETALRESRLEAAARAAEPEWEGLLDVLGSVSVEEENAWTVAGKGKVKVKTKGAAQESRAQARAAASAPLSAGALRLAELDRAAGALRAAKRASAATAADEEQSFADDISRAQQLSRATTAAPSPREQEEMAMLDRAIALSSSEAAPARAAGGATSAADDDFEAALRASAALAREPTTDADLERALAESARDAALEEERALARYAQPRGARVAALRSSGATRSAAAIPVVLQLSRSDVVQLGPARRGATDEASSESVSDGDGMSLFPWEVDGGKSDNEVIHRVLDAAAPSGAAASGTGSAADRGTGIAASSAKQRATPAPPLSPASQSWTPVRAYASAAPAFALPGQMAPYSVGVPPPQALQYARGAPAPPFAPRFVTGPQGYGDAGALHASAAMAYAGQPQWHGHGTEPLRYARSGGPPPPPPQGQHADSSYGGYGHNGGTQRTQQPYAMPLALAPDGDYAQRPLGVYGGSAPPAPRVNADAAFGKVFAHISGHGRGY